MARFGQSFIQALINPSYQQGLFTAAQNAASAPGRYYEEQEKQRKERGLLGGLMAIEQAASSGTLNDQMLKEAAGSLSGLGLPADKVMGIIGNARQLQNTAQTKKEDEKKKRKALEMVSSLGEDFVANADQRLYDKDVISDVIRRITTGQITDLSTALESAQNQTVEKNKQDYYSNISKYDKRIGALVMRGQFDTADQLYSDLNPPEKKQEADKTMNDFAIGGYILTEENRPKVFNAISYSSKDMNEAIRTMNSLEAQSLQNKAARYKGPTRPIFYNPKSVMEEGAQYSMQTGYVDTLRIEAPVDPETGEIQKKWLDDFLKYSAKRIIGRGDLTPEDKKKDDEDGQVNGQVNGQPLSGTGTGAVTPRNLLYNLSSTAGAR
jgi:hypothetical protein